ncbi:MAG: hypothetical protein IIC10_02505 [Proteobacteria bacterium]|nr:hypothetical protein [Pseudomonadota bacterium]
MNRLNRLCLLFMAVLLTGCDELPLQALGQLESDRIELVAEVFESILSINVLEGEQLAAGSLILQQDTSRVEIRIAEARANIVRIEALLAEQISGPRTETIDTVKASLNEAEIDRVFRQRDLNRLLGLREQNLTSIESVDTAEKYVELARARIEIVQAQLAELEAGTRQEQIAQTNGLLEQARAQITHLGDQKDAAQRSADAYKGHFTRVKKQVERAEKCVCPHCNRSFADLRRHMESKHQTELTDVSKNHSP